VFPVVWPNCLSFYLQVSVPVNLPRTRHLEFCLLLLSCTCYCQALSHCFVISRLCICRARIQLCLPLLFRCVFHSSNSNARQSKSTPYQTPDHTTHQSNLAASCLSCLCQERKTKCVCHCRQLVIAETDPFLATLLN
jgi:hypothetical protein